VTLPVTLRRCSKGLLLVALLCPALNAADRQTMFTTVEGDGSTIRLQWDKKHPWDAELSSRGATLIAEYANHDGRIVGERLTSARETSTGSHAMEFRLPAGLTQSPEGPVCLYFAVGAHILPLRQPGPSVPETARFRDAAWESSAAASTEAAGRQRRLAELQSAAATAANAVQTAEENLAARQWSSRAACDSLRAPSFTLPQKPPDVLPADEHEQASRRTCTRRVRSWQEELAGAIQKIGVTRLNPRYCVQFAGDPQTLAELMQYVRAKSGADTGVLAQRERQLAQMEADWDRWASSSDTYVPPFGEKDDHLSLQDIDQEAGVRILKAGSDGRLHLAVGANPDTRLVSGYVGASLEAYSRCVVDGQKELAAKLAAWEEMQARAPALASAAQTQLTNSCRKSFDDLDTLRSNQVAITAKLTAEEAAPAHLHPPSDPARDSGRQALNHATCAPQGVR
jgi:hypothetical protein